MYYYYSYTRFLKETRIKPHSSQPQGNRHFSPFHCTVIYICSYTAMKGYVSLLHIFFLQPPAYHKPQSSYFPLDQKKKKKKRCSSLSHTKKCVFFFLTYNFYFILAMLCGMQDLSSLTGYQTHSPCIESTVLTAGPLGKRQKCDLLTYTYL